MKKPWSQRMVWRVVLGVSTALFSALLVLLLLHMPPHQQPLVSSAFVSYVPPVILPDNPIDFAQVQTECPHAIGWIHIPGTEIDYPLMQSPDGVKEDYYLNHAPNGSYRRSGSIYIQKLNRADLTDPNTLVYGHYMANGSMFADLHKFRKKVFFDKTEYMYIYTPGHVLTYRIYAAFVYNNRHILHAFDFSDPASYAAFLEDTLQPASSAHRVREGVSVTTDDRIVTLSTCTTNDSQRYLVVGVLAEDLLTN